VDEIDGQPSETCPILAAAAINHRIEVLKLNRPFQRLNQERSTCARVSVETGGFHD